MNIAGWIICILIILIFGILAVGGFILNSERRKMEKKIKELEKEGAENAQKRADATEQAGKDKSEVRTGDHSHDLHTMADKLHNYAKDGQ